MAEVYREVHQTVRSDADRPVARREVVAYRPGATVIQRVVYFVAGVIIALLSLRFLLALLGANANNPFANFIYVTSHPFVAPFFGLFNYREQFGVSRFEFETIIAIVVYGLIAVAIVNLIDILQNRDDV